MARANFEVLRCQRPFVGNLSQHLLHQLAISPVGFAQGASANGGFVSKVVTVLVYGQVGRRMCPVFKDFGAFQQVVALFRFEIGDAAAPDVVVGALEHRNAVQLDVA